MPRLRLAVRPGGGVLLLSLAVFVLLPASGSAGRAHVTALDISPIHADFNSGLRETTYSVPTVSDPNATYQWTLTIKAPLGQVDPGKGLDPGCDNRGVLAGTDATFVWHHGNTGDPVSPDGCAHDLQGKWGHQGLITVVVRDRQGDQCTATYKGTYSSDENAALGQNAASDRICTQAPPAPKQPQCEVKVASTGLAVYEILSADPYSLEYADVPVVVTFAANAGQNLSCPPSPSPDPGIVDLSFASFKIGGATIRLDPAKLPFSIHPDQKEILKIVLDRRDADLIKKEQPHQLKATITVTVDDPSGPVTVKKRATLPVHVSHRKKR